MKLVLTDLDDTLFSTPRKQVDLNACVPVSFKEDGSHSGFANAQQQALLVWLQKWGTVVPVTARTARHLERVRLEWGPHAIWNQGAGLRINGVIDQDWRSAVINRLRPAQTQFQELATLLNQDPLWSDASVSFSPQAELENLGCQLVIKQKGSSMAERVDSLRSLIGRVATPSSGFWIHTQRDTLAILPNGITKRAAVERLLAVLKPEATIGVGDSPSDIPFMRLCDFSLFPKDAFALQPFDATHHEGHLT